MSSLLRAQQTIPVSALRSITPEARQSKRLRSDYSISTISRPALSQNASPRHQRDLANSSRDPSKCISQDEELSVQRFFRIRGDELEIKLASVEKELRDVQDKMREVEREN
jgi:hypothetical protein